jgi:hypothetical protein
MACLMPRLSGATSCSNTPQIGLAEKERVGTAPTRGECGWNRHISHKPSLMLDTEEWI